MSDTEASPSPCKVCAFADKHGSWADAPDFQGLTHCRRCHGSWPMHTELQHCTACCHTFTTATAANLHRAPGGACLDPATVLDKAGKPRLALSARKRNPRVTVEIWGQPRADTPYWEDAHKRVNRR